LGFHFKCTKTIGKHLKYQHPIQNTKASLHEACLHDIEYFEKFLSNKNEFPYQFFSATTQETTTQITKFSKLLRENLKIGCLVRVSRLVMEDFARRHWTARPAIHPVTPISGISTKKNVLSHLFIPGIIFHVDEERQPGVTIIQAIFW
jgi:hypothetical protein